MVSQNITDYELYTDATNNRIIVRFPWRSDETDFDPEEAINELSATAQLTFREGMEYETTDYAEDGSPVYKTPTGTTEENIILEGSDVVTRRARHDAGPGDRPVPVHGVPHPVRRGQGEVRRGHRAPGGRHHLHLDGRRDDLRPHGQRGHHQRGVHHQRRLHQ